MLCAFGQAWHKQHQLPMHSCLAQQIHGSTNSVTSLFPQFSKFKTRIPRFCKKGSPISHLGFELLRLQKKLLTLVRFLHQKSTLQWTKSNSKHHWLCNINAWCRSCCFPMFPEAIGQLLMMLMMKPRAQEGCKMWSFFCRPLFAEAMIYISFLKLILPSTLLASLPSVNDSKSSNSSSASNSQTLMMMLAKESINKKQSLLPIFMSFFDYPFLKSGGRFMPIPQVWDGS